MSASSASSASTRARQTIATINLRRLELDQWEKVYNRQRRAAEYHLMEIKLEREALDEECRNQEEYLQQVQSMKMNMLLQQVLLHKKEEESVQRESLSKKGVELK